ncbi:MAG TPA: CpaF family protein [Stellaceae bacterium]|nr:CpaF family protein [Stellaceae bacterium]
MRSASFGRRVVEQQGRELVLVPTKPAAPPVDLSGREELKERIRIALLARIDPSVAGRIPRDILRVEVAKLVSEIATDQRVELNEVEETALAAELTDDMIGLGPLEPFLADDDVTDVLANGPFSVYVERHGKLERTNARFRDSEHLVSIAQRIASAIGRRIDDSSPMVDARLADGSRVNIVLPPLVLNGGTISIRKFPKRGITLDAMVRLDSVSADIARLLRIAARSRLNILISGGTGSGKTTLLNAISRYIDADERIITIEDAAELRLQQPHVVQMETRPPNIEGVGHIPQRELVRNALRMRPDRIIVGEVRGPEAFDMLQAMNTGHDGSMSTVHANSPRDALFRLENMVMMANLSLPLAAIRMQIASALNLIVHIERMRDGVRRVQYIAEVAGMEGDIITLRDLFAFHHRGERRDGRIEGEFRSTRMRPDFVTRAAHYSLDKELLDAIGIAGA